MKSSFAVIRNSLPFLAPAPSQVAITALALMLSLSIYEPALGCGGGDKIEIHVTTPGNYSPYYASDSDVLIQKVVWDDGSEFDEFIYAEDVRDVEYEGTNHKLRVITGHQSDVGDPGVFPVQSEDGDSATISEQDLQLFGDRILNAWNHENINAYFHRRSSLHFSCTVDFEETLRDNSPFSDEVGELIVFEVSGNSWIQLEVLDESGEVVGSPVLIGDYKRVKPDRLYTKKYSNTGNPLCGTYEIKAIGVDLSDFGVSEIKTLRVRSLVNSGGVDNKASIRIVGVKTSTLPTAAMAFD